MPEFTLSESPERLEIVSPMSWGRRALFALLGLFPLIAPWELLIKPDWSGYFNLFFMWSAAISAGALGLSALLFFAALAGLSSRIVLDAASSTFVYSYAAPILSPSQRTYALDEVERVEAITHESSDGPPSYSLRFATSRGTAHETASSWSHDEIEDYLRRVHRFLSVSGANHPPS